MLQSKVAGRLAQNVRSIHIEKNSYLAVLTLIIPVAESESLNPKAVALTWIDLSVSSQKELKKFGKGIGELVGVVLEGREPDTEKAMRLLSLYKNKVEDKIIYFRSIPSANFDEFKNLRLFTLAFLISKANMNMKSCVSV